MMKSQNKKEQYLEKQNNNVSDVRNIVNQNPAKKNMGDSLEEKKTKEKKSAKRVFMTFFAFIFGLIGIAYIFVLWSLIEGGLSNPLFEMLGMQPEELKIMLLNVTNSLFGGISLIFVIATLVKFFQWVMTASASEMKKIYLRRMGGSFGILVLFLTIWIGLYWLISRSNVNTIQPSTESMIITEPSNIVGLTAPVSVKFDIGENLYKKIPAKFVRQIEWDLNGDDVYGDASGPVISHRFLNRGTENGRFLVKAKVFYFSQNSAEENTYIDKREVIISNVALTPILEASVVKGSVPLNVKFSADKSADPDGAIVLYEWDLNGDGDYEIVGPDKSNVEHVFNKIGEHKVSLRVTGQNNDYSVTEEIIQVLAAEEKIRAEISSENSSFEGVLPLTISLDGRQSYTKSGTIVKYEWFVKGDSKSFIGRTLKRTFYDPGEYEVKLTIENKEGDRDTKTQIITVYEKKNVVISSSEKPNDNGKIVGISPFSLTFDAVNSEIPRAIEWKWDFDNDGIYDKFGENVDHTFRSKGDYQVKLTIVDDDNKEYSSFQEIVVSPAGAIAMIAANPVAGEVPLKVQFDGSGSRTDEGEIIDYIWQFQDQDPIHYGGNISREFKSIGIFPVKLTILTSEGERAEKEIFISVRGTSLKALFDISPNTGDAPLKVKFNSSKSTGNIKSYEWDFGDDESSYLNNPEHIYKNPGEYLVNLKITDHRSIVSELSKRIVVTDPKKE